METLHIYIKKYHLLPYYMWRPADKVLQNHLWKTLMEGSIWILMYVKLNKWSTFYTYTKYCLNQNLLQWKFNSSQNQIYVTYKCRLWNQMPLHTQTAEWMYNKVGNHFKTLINVKMKIPWSTKSEWGDLLDSPQGYRAVLPCQIMSKTAAYFMKVKLKYL